MVVSNDMSEYLDGGPQKTRETFWLHFVAGFVLGGLAAFRVLGKAFRTDSVAVLTVALLACATITGFIAGYYLDRFWDWLSRWLRWW
ncbi:MAG: hypothetical protein B9S33_06565 [Pedosphaera sp. Tous-C6FEB]|nr:MAG: hypothetical protein B9S33_06565 [Pedosphaera sp. Tous-C6FEB]